MDNNARFNALLNRCQEPRTICAALMVLTRSGDLEKLRKEYIVHEGQNH